MKYAAIAVTNRCNFKCKMCDIGQKNLEASGMAEYWHADNELTPAQWEAIADRLGISRIHIMGVEPLLYAGIDELLRRLKRKRRYVLLTTNGWLLHEHLDSIAEFVDNTAVSIDGLEETHDSIRGVKGAFRRAFAGVSALKQAGSFVRVSYAITPDNTDDIIPLYERLDRINVPMIVNHYNYIHPASCEGLDCLPTNMSIYDPRDVDVEKVLNAIKHCTNIHWSPNLVNLQEVRQYYSDPPMTRKKRNGGCLVLRRQLRGKRFDIAADGRFIPPGRCWYRFDLGSALDEHALPKKNKSLKTVAKSIAADGFPPPCQRLCCAGKIL